MKTYTSTQSSPHPLFLILFSVAVAAACRPTADLGESTLFLFMFEDRQYEILGYNQIPDREGGINDIILRDSGEVTLWMRDWNQDGYVNSIIKGDISIGQANEIYLAGIRTALEAGKYQEREYERKFEYRDGYFTYEIITVVAEQSELVSDWYNIFVVNDLRNRVSISIRDLDQNGLLDDPLTPGEVKGYWQDFYTLSLQEGLMKRRIEFKEGRYTVNKRSERRRNRSTAMLLPSYE
ncbi:MAG: hypothetical protein LAT67_04340 [Balneolales bacterium]|nr:hypothetical protein [Balneolales bacterium]